MRGKNLQDFHRAFIIRELACYATPKQAADAVNAEFGLSVAPQTVEHYDPSKRSSKHLAAKWKELFAKHRAAFLKHVDLYIPEANKAVRIQQLADSARALKARGNLVGHSELLIIIAKELGGSFTNQRQLSGPDGKAIEMEVTNYAQLTDDQLRGHLVNLSARLTPLLLAKPDEVAVTEPVDAGTTRH